MNYQARLCLLFFACPLILEHLAYCDCLVVRRYAKWVPYLSLIFPVRQKYTNMCLPLPAQDCGSLPTPQLFL
jgi:hypothetical protein